MKFGKYLAKRQLDLPEYSGYFIDYKALKKLIKKLSAPNPEALATASQHEIEKSLQENKASFFFTLERELEKVNNFYLQKEIELKMRINILIEKKQNAYREGRLDSKSSVSYISLHEGFVRFRRDLDRLEQFIELNGTGFSKVLKKWDKRSKSHTKELYLSRQVEIQPVFHREELSNFSDLASSSIMELEAWADGDQVIFESKATHTKPGSDRHDGGINSGKDRDDLYHEFIRMIQMRFGDDEVRKAVEEWVQKIMQLENSENRITRIFLLTIGTSSPDCALQALYESGRVNLNAVDEISGKNCLHRAAAIGRRYVIEIALKNNVDINAEDASGKTPLHYACISNQRNIVSVLVENNANLDAHDKDNYSPLLYGIVNQFEGCVADLIQAGANVQADSEKDYVPLNLACQYGVSNVVGLLLKKNPEICTDAEGLFPLHIAARAGHANLIPLLKPYVDIDQLDKFNGWPALCYAASEGHVETVRALIAANADIKKLDEDGYSALYYASWQGHIDCMGELVKSIPHNPDELPLDNSTHSSAIQEVEEEEEKDGEKMRTMSTDLSMSLDDMEISDIDQIPDLSLPPPIIPLRRYGHNFLEKKIVLQLMFDIRDSPIKLHNTEGTSPAGRLTISTRNNSDFIPRSLILPISDANQAISFQVDSIEDFALDFEIFPTFGTQIIAKSAALPYVFNTSRKESYVAEHYVQLPLFDMRLKAIGEISFRFQVVRPYVGKPLEIAKYDTYWKSTSQVENPQASAAVQQQQGAAVQSLSFVTASSLNGEYARIFVCLTSDAVPVVTAQSWLLDVDGIQVPIGDLPYERVREISDKNSQLLDQSFGALKHVQHAAEVREATQNGKVVIPLVEFLRKLPIHIKLDVGILYPTDTDATYSNIGMSSFAELNVYVDHILKVLFDHAREVRKLHNDPHYGGFSGSSQNRSIIFSSKHPDVCSVLNWKQPNYPVFFHMNALKLHHNSFAYQSAHAFPVEDSDRRCFSIREAASFASGNNLLGVICSERLLGMVPTIIDAVRAMGLVLVANMDEDVQHNVQGCDGIRSRNVLTFKDAIDV